MDLKTYRTVMRLDCLSARFRIYRYVWKVKSVRVENRAKEDWLFFYVVYIRWNGETLSDRQGSKATMLLKPRHVKTSRWVEIQQKGMDDVTDHGGIVNGFQWQMKMQNRHVLLFLDNATCHPHSKFSNVRLAWFPPNTTTVSQPMDQGIVRNV